MGLDSEAGRCGLARDVEIYDLLCEAREGRISPYGFRVRYLDVLLVLNGEVFTPMLVKKLSPVWGHAAHCHTCPGEKRL